LDIFERIYFMRALVGVAGGIVAGLVINSTLPFGYPSSSSPYLVSLGTGIAFYVVSYGIGRTIAKDVPKDKRRKVATEGIIPFIFLLLTFMIIVYTGLNQCDLRLNIPGCQH